jgi:hypothetical protein
VLCLVSGSCESLPVCEVGIDRKRPHPPEGGWRAAIVPRRFELRSEGPRPPVIVLLHYGTTGIRVRVAAHTRRRSRSKPTLLARQ